MHPIKSYSTLLATLSLFLSQALYANQEIIVEMPGGATMNFVWIEPGTFMMGSPESESGRDSDEIQHQVTITQGFYMGACEVTQGQWEAVMGSNPSRFVAGSDAPVESLVWEDVQLFINRLNEMENDSLYRLPTEAEWEYAARAGTTTPWPFGDDENQLDAYAWYQDSLDPPWIPRPVQTRPPNPWGLYDLHGNVWEYVQDWYGEYSSDTAINPTGPSEGSHHTVRGGNAHDPARSLRSANRIKLGPFQRIDMLGMRLLRMGPAPTAVPSQNWGQIKTRVLSE
jgi:formylglycine-generating enzyme required for sulfatase activity